MSKKFALKRSSENDRGKLVLWSLDGNFYLFKMNFKSRYSHLLLNLKKKLDLFKNVKEYFEEIKYVNCKNISNLIC